MRASQFLAILPGSSVRGPRQSIRIRRAFFGFLLLDPNKKKGQTTFRHLISLLTLALVFLLFSLFIILRGRWDSGRTGEYEFLSFGVPFFFVVFSTMGRDRLLLVACSIERILRPGVRLVKKMSIRKIRRQSGLDVVNFDPFSLLFFFNDNY